MKYGRVKFFSVTAGKHYGFIYPEGGGPDVFFHPNDYHHPGTGVRGADRTPVAGDRIAFEMAAGRQGRPKAYPWCFADEVPLQISEGRPSVVRLTNIPTISRDQLRVGDVAVQAIDDVGMVGHGPRVNWVEVVYRPRTRELFQIACWDGEEGGYSPDLERGSLPEGVTIQR